MSNTGRLVWYELLTTDPKAAIEFYTDVIGWKTEPFGGDYTMWTASQGPLGGLAQLPAAWAPDADLACRQAFALGLPQRIFGEMADADALTAAWDLRFLPVRGADGTVRGVIRAGAARSMEQR